MGQYRVLIGQHCQDGKVYTAKTKEDVFESDTDILKLNGNVPMKKFEQVEDNPEVLARHKGSQPPTKLAPGPKKSEPAGSKPYTDDELNMMSQKDLQELAAEEEVSVPANAPKAELVKAIKASQSPAKEMGKEPPHPSATSMPRAK